MHPTSSPAQSSLGRELIEAPATLAALALFIGAILAICGG